MDCGSYNFQEGSQGIENNQFDLIAIGRPFIANPDLVHRVKLNREVTPYHESMLAALN